LDVAAECLGMPSMRLGRHHPIAADIRPTFSMQLF
jgi:hypothetical protein